MNDTALKVSQSFFIISLLLCVIGVENYFRRLWGTGISDAIFCNLNIYKGLFFFLVMRLTKPTLTVTHPVSCDQRDLPGNHFQAMVNRDLATVKGLPCFALGELLTLPQNFG